MTCFMVLGQATYEDGSFQAWMLDTNACPSLGCAVDVEKAVIYPMLCDLLHTVGPAAMNVQWGLYPDNYCRGSSATATGEWP